jgi:hypothetical protein
MRSLGSTLKAFSPAAVVAEPLVVEAAGVEVL